MIRRVVRAVPAVSLLALFCAAVAPARAQGPENRAQPGGSVSGAGMVTVVKKAIAMQVHVELLGQGKTLQEALARLGERREAARSSLESLGAVKGSISFSDSTPFTPQSQNRRQMERMIRERMAAAGRQPKGLATPTTLTVTCTLTAEWPLAGDDPEKRLLTAHALQEKVKAADLGGAKQAKKLSPEEEEAAEEMAEMMSDVGEQEAEPGMPQFVYVAKVTDEERQDARVRAFQKAKAQAAQLAKAAGADLGPLVSLGGEAMGPTEYYDQTMYDYGPYSGRPFLQRAMARRALESEESDKAVVGLDPTALVFRVQVQATFALKK